MADVNSSLDIRATENVTETLNTAQSAVIRFVGAVSASLAAFRIAFFPIQQAIDFERALADVQKTTGFTDSEIQNLGDSLLNLTKEIAVTQVELAEIAAIAGQLGLGSRGRQAIEEFTASVAKASVALDLTNDQAAESAARLLNIFNIPVSKTENLFSLLNELSNNTTASAEVLLNIMGRIGTVAGLTVTEVGALSATLTDLGQSPEVAGTSSAKIIGNFQSEAEDFSEFLKIETQLWVDLLNEGVSTDRLEGRFADLAGSDGILKGPLDALRVYLTELTRVDDITRAQTINQLSGRGRISQQVLKLVDDARNGFALLDRAVRISNKGFEEGTSIQEEYAVITQALKEQLVLLGNDISRVATEIGTEFIPIIKDYVQSVRDFINSDEGRDAFLQIGDNLRAFTESVAELIAYSTEFPLFWASIVTGAKAFIALALLKTFRDLGTTIAAFGDRLRTNLSASWASATAAATQYSAAARAAATVGPPVPVTGPVAAGRAQSGVGAFFGGTRQVTREMEDQRRVLQQNLSLYRQQEDRLRRIAATQADSFDAQRVQLAMQGASARRFASLQEERARAALAYTTAQRQVQQNIAATDAALRNLNISTAASVAAMGGARGALTALGNTARTVGRGLVGIFARAFGILTGPIGQIGLTLFLFRNEIAEFFGFTNEQTAEFVRQQRIAARAAEEAADRIVGAYETAKQSLESGDIEIGGDVIDGLAQLRSNQGFAGFKTIIESNTREVENFARASEGAAIQFRRLTEQRFSIESDIAAAEARLAQLTETIGDTFIERPDFEFVTEEDLRALSSANSQLANQLFVEFRDATEQAEALRAKLAEVVSAQQQAREDFTLFSVEASRIAEEGITSNLTENIVSMLEYEQAIRSAQERLEEIKKEQANLRGQLDNEALANEARVRIDLLDAERASLQANIDALESYAQIAASSATEVEREISQSISNAATGPDGLQSLLESIDPSQIDSEAALLNIADAYEEAFTKAVKFTAAADEVEDSIKDSAEAARAGQEVIKGVYDNLSTEIRKVRREQEAFGDSLDQVLRDRQVEIDFNRRNDRIEDNLQDNLEQIRRRYNPQNAQTESGRRFLELRRKQEEEEARNLAEIQRALLKEKRIRQDLLNIENRFADALAEAKLASESGTPDDLIVARDNAKRLLQEYNDTLKEAAGLTTTNIFGRETPLLSEAQVREFQAQSDNLNRQFRESYGGFVETAKARADELVKQFDAVEQQVKSYRDQANIYIEQLSKRIDNAGKLVSTLAGEFRQANTDLQTLGSTLEASAALTEFDITVDLPNPEQLGEDITQIIGDGIGSAPYDDLRSQIQTAVQEGVLEGFVRQDFGVQGEALAQAIREATAPALEGMEATVDAAALADSIQEGLDNGDFTLRADVDLRRSAGGPVGFSTGGAVEGTGSNFSDSILARLSRKEYVMDAKTTSYFGASFFKGLQNIARNIGASRFRMPEFGLPEMAAIPVPVPLLAGEGVGGTASEGARDQVDVNLKTDSGTFRLQGDRDEVKRLNRALKNLGRGV